MSRIRTVVYVLFLTGSIGLSSQSALPPDSRIVLDDYRLIKSMYPRPEGSAREKQLLEYIEQRLDLLRIPYSQLDFSESDKNHSFSSCLVADIRGELEDTLILAVPINHPPEASAQLDGSINVALALGLAEHISRKTPPITVKILFLGAEYGQAAEYPMGSRLFLRDFFPDYRTMCLYLNLRDIPSRVHLRGGAQGIEAPYWLLDRSTRALEKTDLFFLIRGNENQIFRIGLTSEQTIIEPFLQADYPALSFEGEYASLDPLEQENWIFSFNLFATEFLKAFSRGIPETWDRHYLFFQARGFYFSISEKAYLVILLIVLAGILIYGLVFTRRLQKYLRILAHNIGTLPLFFLFIFVLLFLSTWLIEGILRIRNMTRLWEQLPLLFLLFKLAVPLAILFVLLNLVKRFPIPRRGSFYSAAALLFLLLDIIVLAVINISFTYYFLWAFTFALLFTTTPYRPLKILLFLASPYWIVKSVVELFTLPSLEFCRVLLLSKVGGNLLLTVILIPFILMFIRLRFIFHSARIITDRTRSRLTAGLFTAILIALLTTFFVYQPYGAGRPQPIYATYVIDEVQDEQYLELASPAPLNNIRVLDGSNTISINTRSRLYRLPLQNGVTYLESEVSSVGFLDRKNVALRLDPWSQPYQVRLSIFSEEEFVLFDANFPYTRTPGGKEYTVLIGVNPPLPLNVQLTVPRNRTFTVGITLEYLHPPEGYALSGQYAAFDNRLRFRKNLELKT
ncbi:MAG: hypothetical protein JSV89_07770 [Spirochaetaceae bacterium]|nr:MAG: hypothetical protein JSV89_07770 [Spirochaetaceae bacterium]